MLNTPRSTLLSSLDHRASTFFPDLTSYHTPTELTHAVSTAGARTASTSALLVSLLYHCYLCSSLPVYFWSIASLPSASMQPYSYLPSSQAYTYGAVPPQQPYGSYPQPPPPQQQAGCYAPTGYANYPPPPQGGCYSLSNTSPFPPPPRPLPPAPLQAYPPMQPNVPPAPNYACGGPGYPPNATAVNNYDPRRNDYRY